ncbi:Stonustoxin subunit alpha like protein [Argiope bruennichi]|uniref:Stonustoxin subunit alpha like protein n=1 Tax=Argiope bruennichi TaxID=94029 RepID=A0A8T0FEW4_ARGBR|nr:Stonustoxin subunit alpha like protein [Argiope bruennichi]
MVATCGVGAMLYIVPMLLGRTYDFRQDTVGIDIFSKKDVEDAMVRKKKIQFNNPEVNSQYMTIERKSEKREFLGISGELAIKISSGMVDIKGAGEYLKEVLNTEDSIEILIKLTFTTELWQLSPDARPLQFWEFLDPKTVGTHVVTQLSFGGEIYASVKFISLKSEYTEDIKAQVKVSLAKSGAFDVDAQGKLEKLAKNMTNRAKTEIDYYGTVPLDGVPTTIEGLRELVSKFKEQVGKVNNGIGVALCAEFRALEEFNDKFRFLKNKALIDSMENFNSLFDNLREAKGLLKGLVKSLPETVSKEYLEKVIDFSGRLTKTIRVFYDVIGNLDLEAGSEQLSPALNAFDENSAVTGDQRYTREIKQIIEDNVPKDDPKKPRSVYVHWGKKECGNKASNPLYVGYMTSFLEDGIGAGTNYVCLPEKPNLSVDSDAVGLNERTSKLAAVRYMNMSMFSGRGKRIEGLVTPCVVCETPNRPTVKMFPSMGFCPGDWVTEYTGYIIGNFQGKLRSEFTCIDQNPDVYNNTSKARAEPFILPVKLETNKNSIPCTVCSK